MKKLLIILFLFFPVHGVLSEVTEEKQSEEVIEYMTEVGFDKYIDMECDFKIVKLNELRKNVVLSRKEILASDKF